MHRVQQILNAVSAALSANVNLQAVVEVNRVRSLAEEQQELPALTVNYGSDTPDDGAQDQRNIASALEVVLSAYCAGDTESDVLTALLDIRRETHVAIMADMTQGLSFVWHTAYGGADAPQLQQAERMLGAQSSRWLVRYFMDANDPQ